MWALLPCKCDYVLIKSRFIARQRAVRISSPGLAVRFQPQRLPLVLHSSADFLPWVGDRPSDPQGLLGATFLSWNFNCQDQRPIKTPVWLMESQIRARQRKRGFKERKLKKKSQNWWKKKVTCSQNLFKTFFIVTPICVCCSSLTIKNFFFLSTRNIIWLLCS